MTLDSPQPASAGTATLSRTAQRSVAPGLETSRAATAPRPDWQPALELQETADRIYVQLQLPGFCREAIEIQATPTDVMVRGAHFSAYGSSKGCVLASEFHYGPFERVILLPTRIDPQHSQADFHQGLLTLTLTKATAKVTAKVTAKATA